MTDDKLVFEAGERIFSRAMGACRVVGREVKNIGGQNYEFIKIVSENDASSACFVPLSKLKKMDFRRIARPSDIEALFRGMKAMAHSPDKNIRHRHEVIAKLEAEGTLKSRLAILMELLAHAITTSAKVLEGEERKTYDRVRRLLIEEIALGAGICQRTAEDAIDRVLFDESGEVSFSSLWSEFDDDELDLDLADLEGLDLADLDLDGPGFELEEDDQSSEEEVLPEAPSTSAPTKKKSKGRSKSEKTLSEDISGKNDGESSDADSLERERVSKVKKGAAKGSSRTPAKTKTPEKKNTSSSALSQKTKGKTAPKDSKSSEKSIGSKKLDGAKKTRK